MLILFCLLFSVVATLVYSVFTKDHAENTATGPAKRHLAPAFMNLAYFDPEDHSWFASRGAFYTINVARPVPVIASLLFISGYIYLLIGI